MMIGVKRFLPILLFTLLPMWLAGCGASGDKSGALSIVYGATAVVAVILFVVCCFFKCSNKKWLLLLFGSVSVVNLGYFGLACSETLNQALFANRVSYLGSVFLPIAMFIMVLNTIKVQYKKYLPYVLFVIGAFVFFVAASPGYSDIYYKEVSIQTVNGITVLEKVYGSWHVLYLVYLLAYFAAMMAAVVYASVKKRMGSVIHATVLIVAVFINIGIWLLEQFVETGFELLAVSYIISELFMLGLDYIIYENDKLKALANSAQSKNGSFAVDPILYTRRLRIPDGISNAELETFLEGINIFTETERELYKAYIEGKTADEAAAALGIKPQSLEFYNRNMYCKLGVCSQKRLLEIANRIKTLSSR